MAGGLAAVVYTDALQAIILIGGSILLTGLALDRVGWWPGLTERLQAAGRSDLLSMVQGPESALPFSGFLLGNFLVGGMFYWCMDQVNVQRVLGARNVREARLGAVFAGFLKIIPVFILVLPGVVAAALPLDIRGSGGLPDYNRTYSVLVQTLLPTGLKGIVLAALLAALMSSISSMFNSASTLVARDLVARFKPGISQRRQILVGPVCPGPGHGRRYPDDAAHREIQPHLGIPAGGFRLFFGPLCRRRPQRDFSSPGKSRRRRGRHPHRSRWRAPSFWRTATRPAVCGPPLRHPYLNSFLHRSFLCAVLSFTILVGVSMMTPPPPSNVRAGTFSFSWTRGEGESARDLRVAGVWMICLFVCVAGLWWLFR